MSFVVVLAPHSHPLLRGLCVHGWVREGFSFYVRIIRLSHVDLDANQFNKLGTISCDSEVPTTKLCKYICAIWYLQDHTVSTHDVWLHACVNTNIYTNIFFHMHLRPCRNMRLALCVWQLLSSDENSYIHFIMRYVDLLTVFSRGCELHVLMVFIRTRHQIGPHLEWAERRKILCLDNTSRHLSCFINFKLFLCCDCKSDCFVCILSKVWIKAGDIYLKVVCFLRTDTVQQVHTIFIEWKSVGS
jgi:hypothetical protein